MTISHQKAIMIILASGKGARAGGNVPKQYRTIAGKPVLSYSLKAVAEHTGIERIILVVNKQDESFWKPIINGAGDKIQVVYGGATRQISVANALEALSTADTAPNTITLVHDAARPFISDALVSRAIQSAIQYNASIPVLPITDTIKQVDGDRAVITTLKRDDLRNVQTPQAFHFGVLLEAHRAAQTITAQEFTDDASLFTGDASLFTDDASIVEWAGHKVYSFEGEQSAFKITTEADFQHAKDYVLNQAQLSTRVATGYDVHAFGEGDHVWLGGLKIPHNRSLIGHSDADPVLHALTDAILGTIGDGDIGSHFPPSDPQWKGAASYIFLQHAVGLLHLRKGRLVHLDTTIVCEAPKIGLHRDAMRESIAQICQVNLSRVSVKATTSERLGFTGRGEGIAAFATVTVMLPDEGI
jgi:2-C-methyl-D-erythritol 4-phosphate cytidylyltransferase / 2-C-methyl-D-erythritol 2,4-cyclodiphosphate synthase